jgi:hypothetical protein
VYYHKFDKNRLTLLRARYVRNMREALRKHLSDLQEGKPDRSTLNKIADLEAKIADVQEFDDRLRRLLEGREREARIWCPWKSPDEQPAGWDLANSIRKIKGEWHQLGSISLGSRDERWRVRRTNLEETPR